MPQNILKLGLSFAITNHGYQPFEMIPAISCFVVPNASSDFMSKSIETEGSPDSIFAMRDWLDLRSLASSI